MSNQYPRTFVAYTGTKPGVPLVGGQDCVSSKILSVLWAGSTFDMASQFQDGEVRKLLVTLENPCVIDDECRRTVFGNRSHAWIVADMESKVAAEEAHWDGVVFVDTCDGMEVSDVIVVFARDSSVDHAVQLIGTLVYDEATGEASASDGFHDEVILPSIDRMNI